ncbi:MAG TPA: NEW3 domain-containing protein [Bryobacteraceae bacterium]|nr:NEW3 domain-containing protein [Bryobacteraceae bacterium]
MLTAAALAQGQDAIERVRALNTQVLRLPAQGEVRARARSSEVFAARAEALAEAIAQDPAGGAALAFSPEVVTRLAAEFPESAAALETHGAWRGPVEYLIFDDPEMRNHRAVVRMRSGRQTLDIRFANHEPEELKSGDWLEVAGVRAGNVVAATEGTVQAVTNCSTVGEQKSVVLLVTFPGVAPPALTQQGVWDIFFGASGRSLSNFWREASYGKTWASGDVFGWFTLDAAYTCDQYYQMREAAIRAADPSVDFSQYNRVFLVFPPQGGCSWAGIANVGCTTLTTADGSYPASSAWLVANYMTTRDQGVKLVTHEAGHGLTLGHAASRDFDTQALGPVGTTGTLSEYGDVFNSMGSWNLGHYSAPHKLMLNWLTGAANVRTVESSGSFTLQPMSASPAGAQALKIRRGTGNNAWLWVEYRQPQGSYDSAIGSQAFSGALIHYDDGTAGSKTHLLDLTPETDSWSDPALSAGKTWVDPYSNVSITVESATPTALGVRVEYGATPCVRANPVVTVSPSNPAIYAGGTAVYTVSITNKDSSGCAPGSFVLSAPSPSGWATSLPAASLALSPGQSGTLTMSKSAPAGTAPGTYRVDALATGSTSATGSTANCTVTAPLAPLTVAVAVSPGPYTSKSNVSMAAIVRSGDTAASRATVVFRMVMADGTIQNKSVTANTAGTASWSYRVNASAPKGAYSVTATASYSSRQATSAPAAFTVQ